MIALTNSKKWSIIALALAIIAPIAYLVSTGQMSLSGLRSDVLGSNATCTEAILKKDTPEYRKNIAQRSSMSGEVTIVQAKNASIALEITGLQTKITTLSSENSGYQNQISALNAYINANCKNPKGAQVTTCNQKKKQVQDLQTKINNNLKKITDTNNQIVNKQNTVAINQAKITKLLEQIRQLNVKIYAYESCKLELVTKPIVFGNIMSGEMQIMSGEASASPCQTKIVSGEVMLTNVSIQAPYVSNGVMSGEVMSGEIKPILRVNMENVVFSVKPSNPDNFNIKSWSMRVDNDRVDCKVKKVSASPVELKITCPFAQSATNTSIIEPGTARTFGLIAKIKSIDAPITVETKFTSMNYNGGRTDVDDRTVSNILTHTGIPVNISSISIDKEKNVAHILYCKNSDACAQLYDDKNTLLHSKDLFCPKVGDTAVSLVDMPLLKANMKVRLKNGNENVWSNEAIVADEHPDICVIAPDLCNTVCGNNKKEGAEQCDDGNDVSGDGCSNKCNLETSDHILAANKLANLGIIENHSADPENYRLDESLTRYDAVRATAMALGGILENESSYICTGVFTDIGKTIPTCRVAELSLKAGLVGSSSNMFRPDSKLSKFEAIVFALHGAGIMPEGNFSIGEILNLAVESKLIKQTQGFAASSVVSRGEFYEYLAHAIDASNPENPICSSHPELCAPVCGNTIKEGAEQCDDGNKVDNDNCSNTCKINTPTTASLTINGSHNVTLNVGDQLNYVWTGTNGDSFSSNYTGSPASCTSSNTWVATNASGTWVGPVPASQAGCTYIINYVVKKSAVANEAAKTVTDTVTVKIANTTTTASCTDTDGGMNIFAKGTATNNAAVIPAGRTKSATDVCTKQVGQSFQEVTTCTGAGCFVDEAVCLSGVEAGFVGKGGSGQADHACPNGCSDGACIQSTSTTATAVSNAAGTIATITNGGSGYTSIPVVEVSGGVCSDRPIATATISTSGTVTSIKLSSSQIPNGIPKCTIAPILTIAAPTATSNPVVLNQPTFVAASSTISQYILGNGTSKATFNVTAKGSGTAIIKQLKFKASNPDAIGTIKIGNVTASFIAGVANMPGLNIPVQGDTVQGQNLEAVLTYVIVGSGGVDSGTKVDTVLTEIVYESSDFSQQKLSTSVGTPKMVLVASRPTFIPQQPTSSRLLLGTQIEIIDVTVAAHPAGGDVTLFALPITLGNQNAHINNAANSIRVRADGVLIDTTSDAFADIASNGSTGTIIRFPNGNVIPAGAIRKFQIYVTLSSLLPNASIFASIPGGSGVGLSWSDMTGVLQTDANYAYGSEVISVLSTIKN